MKAVIQRVKRASVTINDELYSKINQGILVLNRVKKGDEIDVEQDLWDKVYIDDFVEITKKEG